MSLKKFLASAVSAAALSVLSMNTHAEENNYAVLMKTLVNPFWSAMRQGVEDGAKEEGVNYYIQSVENDQAADSQLIVCEMMLMRNPSALITAAINSDNLLPCLKKAQEKNIKVVDLDGNIAPQALEKAGVGITFSISSNNEAAGAQGAEYLASRLGESAKGTVLVIEGLSGNVTGKKRVDGFSKKLKSLRPGLNVLSPVAGDWDRKKASKITKKALKKHHDLVAVFSANDGMALGVVDMLERKNKKNRVIAIGVDGNSDAVKSIRAGKLDASVAQLPYLIGKQAINTMQKSLSGERVPKAVTVSTLVLDRQVLERGSDPLLQYVK